MTLSSSNRVDTYTASGSNDTFAYTFKILADADILVQLKDTSNVITTQTLTTDYTVTGAGESSGGNIVFVTNPTASYEVILTRSMDFKQETDYVELDTFPAETHETALDKLAMQDLELLEKVDRAVLVDSASASSFTASLPDPGTNSDKYLKFTSDGTALEAVNLSSGAGTIEVVDDTSPQLGGDLDVNGNSIVSVSAGDIIITPDTTGDVIIDGLKHPQADGTSGQLLQTDGAGQLSFTTVAGAGAAGSNTEIQYNSSGSFAGDSNFTTDGSGGVDITGDLDVDNININGNTIVSTDTAGDINITPDTTGDLVLDGLKWPQADGTSGQTIVTDAAGQLSFADAGGGDYVKLAQATASSSATVEFTGLSSTYRAYQIVLDNVAPATNATHIWMRTSTDNGSTFDSGSSDYSLARTGGYSGGDYGYGNAALSAFTPLYPITGEELGNGTNESISGTITIYMPSSATTYTHFTCLLIWRDEAGTPASVVGGGYRNSAGDVDAIQFLMDSGNIASGTFTVYGIKD